VLTAAAVLIAPACAPPVDLAKNLQVVDVSTAWFDAGIVNGQRRGNVVREAAVGLTVGVGKGDPQLRAVQVPRRRRRAGR